MNKYIIIFLTFFTEIASVNAQYKFNDSKSNIKYDVFKVGKYWVIGNINSTNTSDYKNSNFDFYKLYSYDALYDVIPSEWKIPNNEEWMDLQSELTNNKIGFKEVVRNTGGRFWSSSGDIIKSTDIGYAGFSIQNPNKDYAYYRAIAITTNPDIILKETKNTNNKVEPNNKIATNKKNNNALKNEGNQSNVNGKYLDLTKIILLKGKNFKSIKREFKNQYDIGYHNQLIVKSDTIPAGYWVFLKEGMPKIAQKTESGAQVSIGLNDVAQFGKALAKPPEIYVWKKSRGEVQVFFDDNGTYRLFNQFTPEFHIELIKTDTPGAIFKYLEISFRDPKIPYDVKIKIYKPIIEPIILTTQKEAYCELFTVKKSKGKLKNVALDYKKQIKITKQYINCIISGLYCMKTLL